MRIENNFCALLIPGYAFLFLWEMESLETTEIASQFLHKNEETSPAFSLVAQVTALKMTIFCLAKYKKLNT